jgi:riboflavin-specific deaminase-like protein
VSAEPVFRTLVGDVPDGLTAAEVVEHLPFASWAPQDRPYLVVNMAATLDGRTEIGGRAGPIGNEADRQLFHALRTRGDMVMAGAGTVRAERYGRIERETVVVSRSLRLPADLPLLQEAGRRVVVITDSAEDLPAVPADVRYLRMPVADALRQLRSEGVSSIVCEGGAHLNGTLFPGGLVDELYVCIAPLLSGGPAPLTLLEGPALSPVLEMELAWLLESGGYLFARYTL